MKVASSIQSNPVMWVLYPLGRSARRFEKYSFYFTAFCVIKLRWREINEKKIGVTGNFTQAKFYSCYTYRYVHTERS